MSSNNVIPFITSVVNDIYEKVNELQDSIQKLGTIFEKINDAINQTVEKLSKNMSEMLEETRMNRDLSLEAFSDSMNALLTQIKEIQEEKGKSTNFGEMESTISRLDELSNKLSEKYWDIQLMLTTSNLHTLVDILKGDTKVINVLVPSQLQPISQLTPSSKPTSESPSAQPTSTTASDDEIFAKSPKFKGGRKVKTHDDRLEEMKRKKKLFGKY